MNRKSLVWLLIPLIMIIQCCRQANPDQDEPGQKVESREPDKNEAASIPAFGTVTGDTIHLSGKFVLFYAPDEKSFESQKLERDSLEFFLAMSQALIDSLKSHPEINTGYTSAALFKIYTSNGSPMIITRSALRLKTGFLVGDGMQPPAIKTGINTAAENYAFIKKFFFLK